MTKENVKKKPFPIPGKNLYFDKFLRTKICILPNSKGKKSVY